MATRRKHTPEQVVRELATTDRMLGEGNDVADVCRELQVPSRLTTGCVASRLDRLAALRGYPALLRCDNGPELACARALARQSLPASTSR
jgi:hypothetical protein